MDWPSTAKVERQRAENVGLLWHLKVCFLGVGQVVQTRAQARGRYRAVADLNQVRNRLYAGSRLGQLPLDSACGSAQNSSRLANGSAFVVEDPGYDSAVALLISDELH